jgi:hypothetical protein
MLLFSTQRWRTEPKSLPTFPALFSKIPTSKNPQFSMSKNSLQNSRHPQNEQKNTSLNLMI